jgi:hypothetical protein
MYVFCRGRERESGYFFFYINEVSNESVQYMVEVKVEGVEGG